MRESVKQLTKQDQVSTRLSDESERALHLFPLACVPVRHQEQVHTLSADTTSDYLPSGSRLSCLIMALTLPSCVHQVVPPVCGLSDAWSFASSLASAGPNPLGVCWMLPACSPSSGPELSINR